MLEPLATQEQQLVLREGGIDVRERDGVERKVPGSEPRVLPRVRHRQDVGRLEVTPVCVPVGLALWWRRRETGVAIEPARDVVAVVLLAPEHPRERLAH